MCNSPDLKSTTAFKQANSASPTQHLSPYPHLGSLVPLFHSLSVRQRYLKQSKRILCRNLTMGNYLQEGTCYICCFKTQINLQIIHFKTYSFLWIFFIVLALANQMTQIYMYIERVKRVLYHTLARYSWKRGGYLFLN